MGEQCNVRRRGGVLIAGNHGFMPDMMSSTGVQELRDDDVECNPHKAQRKLTLDV
jgi:hypothetical protein